MIISIKDITSEYTREGFVRYLIEKQKFRVSLTGRVEYYAREYSDNTGGIVRPFRRITVRDGEVVGGEITRETFDSDMDRLYDDYKRDLTRRELKRAGAFGGIVLGIAGLISGLVLGLKRRGRDMVRDSDKNYKRLTPAEKKAILPWTDIERAGGKTIIIIGDYLYVIAGGAVAIYMLKRI